VARRRGEPFEAPRVGAAQPRPLTCLAVENAVEGCVRETFGALAAGFLARDHPDPTIRAVMSRIARDEERHGALAWAIGAWIEPRLDAGARRCVREARDAALVELIRESPPKLVRALTGLPTARTPGEMRIAATYPLTAA
jgi:hypothetical protein